MPGPTPTSPWATCRTSWCTGVRVAVLILFGAVSLVMLINACANVSSRGAIAGAGPPIARWPCGWRWARRAAPWCGAARRESAACAGGAARWKYRSGRCPWGTRTLAAMAQGSLPLASEVRRRFHGALAFTLALSLIAGILFRNRTGATVSRPDLNSVLRSEGRGSAAGRASNVFRRSAGGVASGADR